MGKDVAQSRRRLSLIKTKVLPPSTAGAQVARPRLTGRLAELRQRRATLLQAPAGYGKSSLLVQWQRCLRDEGAAVGWITLESSDRDPGRLLAYVVLAWETGGLAFGAETHGLLDGGGFVAPEALMTALVNDLAAAAQPLFLFLDDLHEVVEPAVQAVIRDLAVRLPGHAHLVCSSRWKPFLPLGRLRAQGELLELHADDLKFAGDEIATFLAGSGHGDLSPELVEAIGARTEGWVAGLKLTSLALSAAADKAVLLSTLSGDERNIAAFFIETVFAGQPADVRAFLLATAILDRMTPDLCDAVTQGADGRRMIERIEESGLFLFALDRVGAWYRYHPLFSGFLRRRLATERPEMAALLHIRASDWYRAHHLDIEAIEHALQGGDPHRAAAVLDACCNAMFYRGEVPTVVAISRRLPAEVLGCYPVIELAVAWWLIVEWRFPEAVRLLDRVRQRLDRLAAEGAMPADELRRLEMLLTHRRVVLHLGQDDLTFTEADCLMLQREFADADPYLAGSFHSVMVHAHRHYFRPIDIDRVDATARELYRQAGYPFALVWHVLAVSLSRYMAGDAAGALRDLEQGVEVAGQFSGISSLTAVPGILLSGVYYERNDLVRAEDALNRYLPAASAGGLSDQLIVGFTTAVRLAVVRGDHDAARRLLKEGLEIAHRRGFERLRLRLATERIRLLLRSGHTDEAKRLAAIEGLDGPRERFRPQPGATIRDEMKAIAWVRMATAGGRIADALAVANAWRSFTFAASALRSTIRWDIMAAKILSLSGEARAAQRVLRRALTLAAPGRYMRSFLDEGEIIITLLHHQCFAAPCTGTEVDRFARDLLAAAGRDEDRLALVPVEEDPSDVPDGVLDQREREILQLVGAGLLNREIGLHLGLTEGSVKWYLHKIFSKLGSKRRSHAVQRARQFGFLA